MPSTEGVPLSIRPLGPPDREAAVAVINAAADWYREFLPAQHLHAPEMTQAYVTPGRQRRGIGTSLREHLEAEVRAVARILVGTYAANHKARRMFEAAGYRLAGDSAALLRRYYAIPEDRLQTSVVYEKTVRPAST